MRHKRDMHFHCYSHLMRLGTRAAMKIANVIVESFFLLPALLKPSGSQRFCCGPFKILLVNVGDDAWEQWVNAQKDVIIAAIEIMLCSAIDPALKVLFGRIRTIHVIRGMARRSVMGNRVFLYFGPPSGDAGECIRCMLNDIIWILKRYDEYYRNCRSTKTSFDIATQYTKQILRENYSLINNKAAQIKEGAN